MAGMTGRVGRRVGEDVAALCIEMVFASAFTATLASQHPLRIFDRLRKFDHTGLMLPDWRLFAPTPVTHDFHLLVREVQEGPEADWQVATEITERRASQMLWFPTRRADKMFLDLCQELSILADTRRDVTDAPCHRILREFARRFILDVNPSCGAFQFTVMRTAGHDESVAPDCTFVSAVQQT